MDMVLSDAGAKLLLKRVAALFEQLRLGQHQHRGPLTFALTEGMTLADAVAMGGGDANHM